MCTTDLLSTPCLTLSPFTLRRVQEQSQRTASDRGERKSPPTPTPMVKNLVGKAWAIATQIQLKSF